MHQTMLTPQTIRILGVALTPMSIAELDRLAASIVDSGDRSVIANHNLHSVYLYHRDAAFRRFFESAVATHIDGMPLLRWARWMGHPLSAEKRVTYVDWLPSLLAMAAEKEWRVFFLGSRPGIADEAARRANASHPGLDVATAHGYFDHDDGSAENRALLQRIEAFAPQLLVVGMGMPLQEHWISENLPRLPACVVLPAGASLDFLAGAVPTPPRWMGRAGLEWLHRLAVEPGRLWRRYLVEPWALLPYFIADAKKRRHG